MLSFPEYGKNAPSAKEGVRCRAQLRLEAACESLTRATRASSCALRRTSSPRAWARCCPRLRGSRPSTASTRGASPSRRRPRRLQASRPPPRRLRVPRHRRGTRMRRPGAPRARARRSRTTALRCCAAPRPAPQAPGAGRRWWSQAPRSAVRSTAPTTCSSASARASRSAGRPRCRASSRRNSLRSRRIASRRRLAGAPSSRTS